MTQPADVMIANLHAAREGTVRLWVPSAVVSDRTTHWHPLTAKKTPFAPVWLSHVNTPIDHWTLVLFYAAPRPPERPKKVLASGPVSRILFHALRRFGSHFSQVRLAADLPFRTCVLAHSRAERCGIPVTIGRAVQSPILPCTGRGLSCRRRRRRRGGLLPHLFTLTARLPARRYILCDTFRRRALKRTSCARREAGTASCPVVSGLSSPRIKTGAALPAPWDQRTWSDCQAPKLRPPPELRRRPGASSRSIRPLPCQVSRVRFRPIDNAGNFEHTPGHPNASRLLSPSPTPCRSRPSHPSPPPPTTNSSPGSASAACVSPPGAMSCSRPCFAPRLP